MPLFLNLTQNNDHMPDIKMPFHKLLEYYPGLDIQFDMKSDSDVYSMNGTPVYRVVRGSYRTLGLFKEIEKAILQYLANYEAAPLPAPRL